MGFWIRSGGSCPDWLRFRHRFLSSEVITTLLNVTLIECVGYVQTLCPLGEGLGPHDGW